MRYACHGGCPKGPFTEDPSGEGGLNYPCPSFKAFFGHVDGPMKLMGELLAAGRAPSEIVALTSAEDARRGRNDPCPCNGGRKWKRCHGEEPPVRQGGSS